MARCFGRRRAALLVAALVFAASCIVLTGRTGDSIRFDEADHSRLMHECVACHRGIDDHAVDSSTRRAMEASCLACHMEQRDNCSWCHEDVGSAGVFPDRDRSLSFSHREHLERTQGDCTGCHPGAHGVLAAGAVATAAEPAMPAHDQCFSCHQMEEFYEELECGNCHEELARYGLMPYESFTHAGDFVARGHGALLRSSGNVATCAQCHEQSTCDTCHFAEAGLGALRLPPALRLTEKSHLALIHRGDYLFRHPWDARADSGSCVKCHSPDYCRDCHDQRGLSSRAALTRTDGYQYHGPGILFPGSPEFHGSAARRDPISCAACHEDGSAGNCTSCHAEGAFGGNPHPKNWKSRLDKRSAQVCRLCHTK